MRALPRFSKSGLRRSLSVMATLQPQTWVQSLRTPQSLDRALAQVEDAKKHGARILLGGKSVPDSMGFFWQPTIIADATKQMRITDEETFSPVLALYRFERERQKSHRLQMKPL